jgi:hypothetical protein
VLQHLDAILYCFFWISHGITIRELLSINTTIPPYIV